MNGAVRSERVALPLIGRATSRIGFGTAGLLRIASERGRRSMLEAALACGITHFDTAPIYGFGESERTLGRFLLGRRDRVTLTTKFGLRPSRLAARLAVLQRVGRLVLKSSPSLRRVAVRNTGVLYATPCFSRKAAEASLEASLRALRTDYLDFYLAHQASPGAMPDEEVLDWLEGLRGAGRIRAYGIATDFEQVGSVLERRPQLSQVVQFDSDLTRSRTSMLAVRPGQLLITFGSLRRSIELCRARLPGTSALPDRAGLDDETLGTLLLRAAVLANPDGIVLMQSRSIARIERNVRAANSEADDERVRALASLAAAAPSAGGTPRAGANL